MGCSSAIAAPACSASQRSCIRSTSIMMGTPIDPVRYDISRARAKPPALPDLISTTTMSGTRIETASHASRASRAQRTLTSSGTANASSEQRSSSSLTRSRSLSADGSVTIANRPGHVRLRVCGGFAVTPRYRSRTRSPSPEAFRAHPRRSLRRLRPSQQYPPGFPGSAVRTSLHRMGIARVHRILDRSETVGKCVRTYRRYPRSSSSPRCIQTATRLLCVRLDGRTLTGLAPGGGRSLEGQEPRCLRANGAQRSLRFGQEDPNIGDVGLRDSG